MSPSPFSAVGVDSYLLVVNNWDWYKINYLLRILIIPGTNYSFTIAIETNNCSGRKSCLMFKVFFV